tara:strand:+ start:387 stop:1256 length:870 start_codon:yes stop_codon:yes gene_type:complete
MKNKLSSFAVLILSHGRSENVRTYNILRKRGYTGRIYIVVDDEDTQVDNYKKLFSDVYVFCKKDAMEITDTQDNGTSKAAVVFARNYAHKIAKEIGIEYFLELDDDYSVFRHACDGYLNYVTKDSNVNSLDNIFEGYLDFLETSGALTVCFSQGGDFIGGEGSGLFKKMKKGELSRKAMNAFFMKTDRPFKFTGRINEDVNAYVTLGIKGEKLFTVGNIRLEQCATQQNSGGLTDLYLEKGTYVKSFYSVMCAPSCVSLMKMGVTHPRIHHRIDWKKCSPKIISEKLKK